MEVLAVYRRRHPESAVPAGAVLVDLQVREERRGEFDPGERLLPIEHLGLQPT